MNSVERSTRQGYSSLIRWCPDVVRAEYRNLGVILISGSDAYQKVKHLDREDLPYELRNAGIMYDWLVSFSKSIRCVYLEELKLYSRSLCRSVAITPPKPVGVVDGDWDGTLEILWKALVEPK